MNDPLDLNPYDMLLFIKITLMNSDNILLSYKDQLCLSEKVDGNGMLQKVLYYFLKFSYWLKIAWSYISWQNKSCHLTSNSNPNSDAICKLSDQKNKRQRTLIYSYLEEFFRNSPLFLKVYIFWEGHKICRNYPISFDVY